MTSAAPIGMFDSGFGGLTVAAQLRHDMPHEEVLFFGDSAHAPYGLKTPDAIRERCFSIANDFMAKGVKALVVACNTATSACVEDMRQRYDVPVIGMEPALKVACDRGQGVRQHVIVAATPLTLHEHKFAALMDRFTLNHDITPLPCPDLVTTVESGRILDEAQARAAVRSYFGGFDWHAVDAVVLGCTHFVFFRKYFTEMCPENVAIIDGNQGTIRHLHVILEALGDLAPSDATGGITIANSDTSPAVAKRSEDLFHLL
ncbi:glutamate racemase [Bifidobacterium crudilactis]|jgi:glutamate racemase|uniref:glutamate racemase n=1 Tax=Bifidobacterium crudilactis TaxID=327277 RepID=UPI0023577495|nr:glutamate racemase [Bifidobacterium crudilactis]MCI1217446.1 glutamate racemase [Bifidobacterium crudilactis]